MHIHIRRATTSVDTNKKCACVGTLTIQLVHTKHICLFARATFYLKYQARNAANGKTREPRPWNL